VWLLLAVLFSDTTFVDLFNNETEFAIFLTLTSPFGGTSAAPAFTNFVFPRCKAGGATKDDVEKGITLTFPFTALEQTAGGTGTANLDTTISVQDSAFV
jgi:hypothetical protein